MKSKYWGAIAVVISMAMWIWFAWIWLAVALPDSTIWEECQDYFADTIVLNISRDIAYIIIVFFVPISIISLTSSVFLIRMRPANIWGKVAIISSSGALFLCAIAMPGLVIYACKGASFAIAVTLRSFFILSITSLISGIVLVKVSKRKVNR